MNQTNRICTMQGHEGYNVYHICTFSDCKQNTRWCCPECFSIGIHLHNQPNNLHVMSQQKILSYVSNECENLKNDYLDKYKTNQQTLLEQILKECQKLEKLLSDYMKYVEKQIQFIISEQDQQTLEEYLCSLRDNNYLKLDDDQINKLLNINQFKFNKNRKQYLEQSLNIIKQSLDQIETITKVFSDQQNDNAIDLKNRKYILQEIDQGKTYQYGSQISNNQKYLAYGGYDKLLKIYDIELKKLIKEIKLDYGVWACQFTQDSSQLYVGLHEGYVCGYEAQDDFKEIFKQQIHSQHVYDLKTIQNQYLITSSHDKSIIKTDIKSKKQLFKLTGHTKRIIAFDYDDKEEIIASGSDDRSIKLWSCMNQSIIINKEQSHNCDVRQVQLINKNQNLLSLDIQGNLYKWNIDLINKDLIKLQQFIEQNKIFNFDQINQDQNLLLICNNNLVIYNQQGEILQSIQHNGQNSDPIDCTQLNNLKYIQIRCLSDIILTKQQKQYQLQLKIDYLKHKLKIYFNNNLNKFIYRQIKQFRKVQIYCFFQ